MTSCRLIVWLIETKIVPVTCPHLSPTGPENVFDGWDVVPALSDQVAASRSPLKLNSHDSTCFHFMFRWYIVPLDIYIKYHMLDWHSHEDKGQWLWIQKKGQKVPYVETQLSSLFALWELYNKHDLWCVFQILWGSGRHGQVSADTPHDSPYYRNIILLYFPVSELCYSTFYERVSFVLLWREEANLPLGEDKRQWYDLLKARLLWNTETLILKEQFTQKWKLSIIFWIIWICPQAK